MKYIEIADMSKLQDLDALIISTCHEEFKKLTMNQFEKMFKDKKIIIDVKGILNKEEYKEAGYSYWRL